MGRPKGLPKTGGRQKGSTNKRQAALVAAVEASGLMPLDYMLGVLRDPHSEANRRDWAAKEAAPYLHAKLTSTNHSGTLSLNEFIYQCGPNKSLSIKPAKPSGHTMNGANGSASALRTEDAEKQ
jgi:hypothetical protein